MAPSNILGIRNNNVIVPYTAATKRTKELNLASVITTTDWTCSNAIGRFEADSAGQWRLIVSGKMVKDSGTTTSSIVIAIANVDFTFDEDIGITVWNSGAGNYKPAAGRANGSTGTIDVISDGSTAYDRVIFTVNVVLTAEPTTYTTAANIEGVTAVDVLIPFGQTGMTGETSEDTTNGTSWDGTTANLSTLSLTKGKWLVSGNIRIDRNGATPNGHIYCGISDTSVMPSNALCSSTPWYVYATGNDISAIAPGRVFTLTATTSINIIGQTSLSAGSLLVDSYITAVRLAPG
jgi:hypothetical protein